MRTSWLLPLLASFSVLDAAEPLEPPQSLDPALEVVLVAQAPQVRTPTALRADGDGNLWVLENNTHFRPKDYSGPATDRLLVFSDFDPPGRAGKASVVADGFRDGMGLQLLQNGEVILVTRSEVLRLGGRDFSGVFQRRQTLLKLDTKTSYPHNGLSGTVLDGEKGLFIGLGENFGQPWKLTGTDGVSISGADEGGVFWCDLNGAHLRRWCQGLWNPFTLAITPAGQLFALDNDPGSGSLCRLLHLVPDGDYGYRYRYGRTTEHPFLSWLGQIPGTLPPVCLSGEAPTGLLAYAATGGGAELPPLYHGELLGCAWGDHGVQRFPLTARGSSFSSKPEWIIRGGDDFRPSAMDEAPDGSLVLADWASSSYEVNGKGRVWRIRPRAQKAATAVAATPRYAIKSEVITSESLVEKLRSKDPFVWNAALAALAEGPDGASIAKLKRSTTAEQRLAAALASRRRGEKSDETYLLALLQDPSGAVRRAALQWVSEERLEAYQPLLERSLEGSVSGATLKAYLAAIEMLASDKPNPQASSIQTARIALDPAMPPVLRALALHLLPAESPDLAPEMLEILVENPAPEIAIEAARMLAARPDPASQNILRQIMKGRDRPDELRAEAAAGLALSVQDPETKAVLSEAMGGAPKVAGEAARSLGQAIPAATSITPEQPGDPAVGRRLFYHPNGPRCYTCHSVDGRGGVVGPDLAGAAAMTEEQILTAIQDPSRDIAPNYTQWLLTFLDDSTAMGIDLYKDDKMAVTLVNAAGRRTEYKLNTIRLREPLAISLMPPNLDAALSPAERADLIAFLKQPRD